MDGSGNPAKKTQMVTFVYKKILIVTFLQETDKILSQRKKVHITNVAKNPWQFTICKTVNPTQFTAVLRSQNYFFRLQLHFPPYFGSSSGFESSSGSSSGPLLPLKKRSQNLVQQYKNCTTKVISESFLTFGRKQFLFILQIDKIIVKYY